MPKLISTDFKALPAMLLISLCKKLVKASPIFMFTLPPPPPPPRYIPVTSMLTASFARSSGPFEVSSSCIAMSSGAVRVNCNPRFSSCWVSSMPTSKFTKRGDDCPVRVTDVRTRSVAVRFKVGSMGLPVHCT